LILLIVFHKFLLPEPQKLFRRPCYYQSVSHSQMHFDWMAAGVGLASSSAVDESLAVVAVVGSRPQSGLTVVRLRTAGVAMLNGIPEPGFTTATGRDVVVVVVVVAGVEFVVGKSDVTTVVYGAAVLGVLLSCTVSASVDTG